MLLLDLVSWPSGDPWTATWKPVELSVLSVDGPYRRRLAGVRCRHMRREALDRRVVAEMEEIHDADPGTAANSDIAGRLVSSATYRRPWACGGGSAAGDRVGWMSHDSRRT